MKATDNAEALQSLTWDSCTKPSALALDHSPTIPFVSQPAFYSQVKKQYSDLSGEKPYTVRNPTETPIGTYLIQTSAQPQGHLSSTRRELQHASRELPSSSFRTNQQLEVPIN